MEEGDDLPHGDDGEDLNAVVLAQLIQGGALPGAPLHPVHRDEQGFDVHVGHMLEQLDGLAHGGAGGDYVLHDGHVVPVLGLVAHHGTALAVVLGLLAVEAVGQIPVIIAVQGGGGGHRQGDALVGRSEQAGNAVWHVLLDTGSVVVPQLGRLGTGLVVSGIDKIGGLAAGFGGEVPEGEHAGAHHERDKFFLVGHTKSLIPFIVLPCQARRPDGPDLLGEIVLLYHFFCSGTRTPSCGSPESFFRSACLPVKYW